MAEPSQTSQGNITKNLNLATTIQPTIKLGGRGTPRRKTRRPNSTNHSSLVAARALESKLKPFRTQFQLYDQQEPCDVSILYEDGHVNVLNQARVHSTWPMTMHEIDSSDTNVQTHNIKDLDSASCEYLFGNVESIKNELNQQSMSVPMQPITTATSVSNYVQDLQQRQFYSQSSNYFNYSPYQYNPYRYSPYDNYARNIRQIYGSVNPKEDEEQNESNPTSKKSKRRRRRHKHRQKSSEQSPVVPSVQNEMVNEIPTEHLENENITTEHPTKNKRRRIRRSKRSLSLSSDTGVKVETSTITEINTSSSTNESNNEVILSPSLISTQGTEHEPLSIEPVNQQVLTSTETTKHVNENSSPERVMNVLNKSKKKKRRKEKEELKLKNSSQGTNGISSSTFISTISQTASTDGVSKTDEKDKNIPLTNVNNELDTTILKSQSPIDEIIDNHNKNVFNKNDLPKKDENINDSNDQQQIISFNSQQKSLSDHIEVSFYIVIFFFRMNNEKQIWIYLLSFSIKNRI